MTMSYRVHGTILALAASCTALNACGQERRLQRSQMPAAVLATIDREAHGAPIVGFASEREHGHTVYEAETVVAGHSRDLQVAEDGALIEIEEEVAWEALPPSVRAALAARAAASRITKVESLTKSGHVVAYEASIRKGGKKGEIQVGPAGNRLSHQE